MTATKLDGRELDAAIDRARRAIEDADGVEAELLLQECMEMKGVYCYAYYKPDKKFSIYTIEQGGLLGSYVGVADTIAEAKARACLALLEAQKGEGKGTI